MRWPRAKSWRPRWPGFTPAQISEQCAGFGPVLKEHVAALSLKPAADVVAGVEGFVLQSGMAPAQLSGTAKVCLGVGYTTDDMDVAIGSALLLAALGEGAYTELLGHHLSQGYGANIRPDLAMEWYDLSLASGGQVFAPGLQGRGDLIRKAAYTINGRAAEVTPEPVVQEAALPAFTVAPEAAIPGCDPRGCGPRGCGTRGTGGCPRAARGDGRGRATLGTPALCRHGDRGRGCDDGGETAVPDVQRQLTPSLHDASPP